MLLQQDDLPVRRRWLTAGAGVVAAVPSDGYALLLGSVGLAGSGHRTPVDFWRDAWPERRYDDLWQEAFDERKRRFKAELARRAERAAKRKVSE